MLARQLETQQYKPALVLIETLLTELRRLDDKMILTEVHLLESRVYRGIGNLAKAKVRHLHPLLSHVFLLPSVIVRADLRAHSRQLNILPTPTPGCTGLTIRNSSCGGQGLYDGLLLLLRDVREFELPGRPICARRSQIHAFM